MSVFKVAALAAVLGSGAYAAPAPQATTTYACNPAHSYPNGASCISTGTGLTLVTPSATSSSSAEATYACNPAHSYPNGASCISTGTGLTLVTPTPSASSATYACNPAHSYPNGASCISTGTGLTLVTPSATSSSSAEATYACNPAHSYPNGAVCVSSGTGLTLVTPTPTPQAQYDATVTVRVTKTSVISACDASSAPPATSTAKASTSSAAPSPSASSKCPLDLVAGTYEYPHLLEINGKNGYFGQVDKSSNTTFTFDIPAADAGKKCDTYFLLPSKNTLETTDYNLTVASGAKLGVESTGGAKLADFPPAANNKYLVQSGNCPAGSQLKYNMYAEGDVSFGWFQDYNPCALGMFVIVS